MTSRRLYRPACRVCGWHGVTIADEAIAQHRSARHVLTRNHDGWPVVETAIGPNPSPWSWAPTGEATCRTCGAPMFLTDSGVSHHAGDGPSGIDHDADADHVALQEA